MALEILLQVGDVLLLALDASAELHARRVVAAAGLELAERLFQLATAQHLPFGASLLHVALDRFLLDIAVAAARRSGWLCPCMSTEDRSQCDAA